MPLLRRLPALAAGVLAVSGVLAAGALLTGCALGSTSRYAAPDVPPTPPEPFARAADSLLTRPDLQHVVDLQVRRRGDLLIPLLSDTSAAVRARAAFALASVQDEAAVPALVEALTDPEPRVRADAAFALGQTADSTAADALFAALVSERTPSVRRELLDALGKTGGRSALRRFLSAPVPAELEPAWALAVARFGLRGVHDSTAVTRLAHALTLGTASHREAAAYYFGRVRDTAPWAHEADRVRAAFDALYARDAGDDALMHLALAVGRLGTPADAALLRTALGGSPDWRVRTNAARALGGLDAATPGRTDALLAALDDASHHVAVTAANALAAHPDALTPAQIDTVAAWVDTHQRAWPVAGALFPVLVHHGRTDVAFGWVDRSRNPFARALALTALADATAPAALDRLFTAASDEDPRVAYAALEALKERWGATRVATDAALRQRYYDAFAAALRRRDLATAYAAAPALADSLFWDLGSGALLREVYAQMEAPADIEPMVEIVRAAGQVRDGAEIEFLVDVAMQAPHPVLREAAEDALNGRLQEGIDVTTSGPEDPSTVEINWERLIPLGPTPLLTLFTDRGPVAIELYPEQAPQTVYKIWRTVTRGEYDGVPFHRVVPNFVVQGGDFYREDGFGGPDVPIRSEFTRLRYTAGTVGMASAGKDTEGVQYFATHSPQPHLDGRYSAFGRVVLGQDVVDAIQQGDLVLEATITPTNLR